MRNADSNNGEEFGHLSVAFREQLPNVTKYRFVSDKPYCIQTFDR